MVPFDFFRLPEKEQARVEEILAKSLRKERGEPIEIGDVITVPDDDDKTDEGTEFALSVGKLLLGGSHRSSVTRLTDQA